MSRCRARFLLIACGLLSSCRTSAPAAHASTPASRSAAASSVEVHSANAIRLDESQRILAILPFRNKTDDSDLEGAGTVLADAIAMSIMSKRKDIVMVERERIETLFAEMKLGLSGAIDAATAARIGKLLGARFLAFGAIRRLGGRSYVSARLVDVETGRILCAASAKSAENPDWERMGIEAAKGMLSQRCLNLR